MKYELTRHIPEGMGGGHTEKKVIEVKKDADAPEDAVRVDDDAELHDWQPE